MQTHALLFIQDLAILMIIAGLTTVVCHRLKQPIVLGYILAGIIIGPHTPPFSFIHDEATINTLAELGVIFLMFALGLEFNLHKLTKVGFTAFVAALLEILLMIGLGYKLGRLFGWTQIDSIFLGAILSISSTTIIVKALSELGMNKEKFAQLIFGILIVEDIFAILILALLSSIAISGSLPIKDVLITATQLSSFLVISLLLGILLVPRWLSYIAKFNNSEVLLISVLGLCFGFCLLVIKLDYSVALGAFIIGAIIAESRQLTQIENLIMPIRDMFSAIFFVSVGLLFNPNILAEYLVPIIVITIAVILGKVISSSLGVLITGRNSKTALRVGMGLAQIGEFSFIIASLGITLKVTGAFLYSIAVCVSIITTLLTPYLIKYSDFVAEYLAKIIPRPLAIFFKNYAAWMQNTKLNEDQLELKMAMQRSVLQIIINLFVVSAIFISGAAIANTEIGEVLAKLTNIYWQKTIIWALAMIISLPFLIATYRKMKALCLILSEMNIKNDNNQVAFQIKKVMLEIVPVVSILIIMIFISLLSTSILPPIELLIIVLAIVLLLMILLFPWFVKLHAKLQISVIKALKKNKDNQLK